QTWDVRVTPHLPAGLDPNQWQFRTIDGSLQTSVKHCDDVELTLQLVNVEPTPVITSLPVTGAAAPPGSLATTALGLTTMALGLALRARRKDDNAS
ncbi:MAG TPA: LPXTG cell wall anchor domain-containing protein, partial [Chloroflexi bacterium]|nr:LPXTG cell wall anchor domain-containing protein [Chloroflexota bacterium]